MENVENTGITEEIQEEVQEEIQEEVQEEPEVKIGDVEYTESVKKQMTKLRKRAQKAERERDSLRIQLKEVDTPRPVRPNPESFEYGATDPKYNEALDKYEDDVYSWRQSQEKKQELNTTEFSEEEMASNFIEKAESIVEKYPDFWDIAGKDIYGEEVRFELYDHEKGPELAYYLGTHQTELSRLNYLGKTHPEKMIEEIDKIENRIFAKRTSTAPNPINPVDDVRGGNPKNIDEIKDDQAWFDERKKQRLRKIRGG